VSIRSSLKRASRSFEVESVKGHHRNVLTQEILYFSCNGRHIISRLTRREMLSFRKTIKKDQQDSRVRIMWKETENAILKKLI